MTLKLLVVGKKHESWVSEGIERYQKRLKRPFDIEWVLLPHSAYEDLKARQDESERILLRLMLTISLFCLMNGVKTLDSPALSTLLTAKLDTSQPVTLIIGGAYGVDETVHRRADFVWSLSPLVFPHQLVRLILIEQLYRAQEIAHGHPYHHE